MADHLGAFEQAVLLAIVRLGEHAYGRAILKEVQTRLERDVALLAPSTPPSNASRGRRSCPLDSDLERRFVVVGRDASTACSPKGCAHSTTHVPLLILCGKASSGH
jgi:hypothetical protein